MTPSPRSFLSVFFVLVGLLFVSGCGITTGTSVESAAPATSSSLIQGKLHGGQQPVSGSTIQLYAASLTTSQGASTALLNQTVTSDSKGNFSISGHYTCPTGDALVYIVATGGNPGLAGSVNNTGIAMMSLLGSCKTLVANAATTYIDIDELTTVVAVQALAPFMTDYAHVGSAPSSVSGVGGAFDTALSEVDFSTGQYLGGPNLYLPEVTFDTIADILSACINSASGSSQCTTLFSNTGGTSDTIGAALQMAKTPGQNTATLYGLIPASPPFQPYFTAVPTDFTATVGYAVPAFVQNGVLDSNGHIWLYFGGYNYNPTTDTSTDSPGYITVYDNNFAQLFTISAGTGGLYYPSSFAPDASGHVFVINANNTVSEFDSNGAALSPATGWATGYTSTFTPTGPGNGYVYSSSQAGPITVDALGNIWGGTPYTATGGKCYFELNSSGVNITPTGNFCTVTGISNVQTAAVDGLGSAWALDSNSIAKVNAQGSLAALAPLSQGCFYPESQAITSPILPNAFESITLTIAYDRAKNQLWGYSETGAGAITDGGVAAFCDFGSTALPVIPDYASNSTTPGAPYSGGNLLINSAVLDGAGNLWFVSSGFTATGVVGSASGTFTGTGTYASYLGEISSSGALVTPYNASTKTYGLQPTGFGANVTATATNVPASSAGPSVGLLGVDRFGNIWALDAQSYRLLKITGLAVANTLNY